MQELLDKYGGTVELALDNINRRLEVDAKNPYILGDLGYAYRITGQNKEAAEAFAKALSIMKHPELYHSLATCLVVIDRVDEAMAALQQGIKDYPLDQKMHFSIGLIYMQTEEWHQAIAAFEQLYRLNRNFAFLSEHLLMARREMRKQTSSILDTGVFVMFMVTILIIAWMRLFHSFSSTRSSRKGMKMKQKRK